MRQLMALGRGAALGVLGVLLAAAPAGAQSLELKDMELRFTFFDQSGLGYQSQAGPVSGPGSEDALIYQPQLHLHLGSASWRHDAVVSVDIVSNASTDALDAMSSASRLNESLTIDATSTYEGARALTSVRYGFHVEEPFRSGFLGGGYTRKLADDNATLGVSGLLVYDSFDAIPRTGGSTYPTTQRYTANANLTASQILSPTTIADATYGFTVQTGRLETTYNSVPLDGGGRGDEIFRGTRTRHAVKLHLAQHIPATGSTLQASYRFYADSYDLVAHTAELQAYQYLVPWLYARGSYRLHHQSGVDFFGESFAPSQMPGPQTSDSDLAPFFSHEVGVTLHMLGDRAPFDALGHSSFEAAYYRYWRSNDLAVNWFVLAVGHTF